MYNLIMIDIINYIGIYINIYLYEYYNYNIVTL